MEENPYNVRRRNRLQSTARANVLLIGFALAAIAVAAVIWESRLKWS